MAGEAPTCCANSALPPTDALQRQFHSLAQPLSQTGHRCASRSISLEHYLASGLRTTSSLPSNCVGEPAIAKTCTRHWCLSNRYRQNSNKGHKRKGTLSSHTSKECAANERHIDAWGDLER